MSTCGGTNQASEQPGLWGPWLTAQEADSLFCGIFVASVFLLEAAAGVTPSRNANKWEQLAVFVHVAPTAKAQRV